MDKYALRVANLLVGNEESAAALEMTLAGPELEAGCDLLVAVCGAYMSPRLDGEELPMWRPVLVPRGARLSFGSAKFGCRAYLAVAGGIDVPLVLGSRSTDLRAGIGGFSGRALAAGDALPCGAGAAAPSPWAAAWMAALAQRRAAGDSGRQGSAWAAWYAPPFVYGGGGDGGIELRAMPGTAHGLFGEDARARFYRERYRVAPASDRMGVRLDGPPPVRESRAELLSHGVLPGAVQVPDGAGPIVLAAGCQTTGGYPVIAQVATVDLPLLAQAKPGDWVRFRPIALAEAQRLDLMLERAMRVLKTAIRCRLP